VSLEGTRLHSGSAAQRKARDERALAVTEGTEISFAQGELSASTSKGRMLLGHELVHVAQQRAAGVPTIQGKDGEPAPGKEPPKPTKEQKDGVSRLRELLWRKSSGQQTVFDEIEIERVWRGFGDAMPAIATANPSLWQSTADQYPRITAALAVPFSAKFAADVLSIARGYLQANEEIAKSEIESYGLSETGDITTQVQGGTGLPEEAVSVLVTEEQKNKLVETRRLANVAVHLKKRLVELRKVKVGWDGFTFDPNNAPRPENALKLGEQTFWASIKDEWDRGNQMLSLIANSNPTLFSLMQESPNALESFANLDPEKKPVGMLGVVRQQMMKILVNIRAARASLDAGNVSAAELGPIHQQLFAGGAAPSKTPWSQAWYKGVATRFVQGKQSEEFWRKLGLEAAVFAAFVVAEVASFGSATFLIAMGAGLGGSALKANEAQERAEKTRALGGAAARPGLELVYKGQVTAAEAEAEEARIGFLLDAAGAGLSAFGAARALEKATSVARDASVIRRRYAAELIESGLTNELDKVDQLLSAKKVDAAGQQLGSLSKKLADLAANNLFMRDLSAETSTLAIALTRTGHKIRVTESGAVALCSYCSSLSLLYSDLEKVAGTEQLFSGMRGLEARARTLAQRRAKGEKVAVEAREIAIEAAQIANQLDMVRASTAAPLELTTTNVKDVIAKLRFRGELTRQEAKLLTELAASGESLTRLPPSLRGRVLHTLAGETLVPFTPTIDKIVENSFQAWSIKSKDPRMFRQPATDLAGKLLDDIRALRTKMPETVMDVTGKEIQLPPRPQRVLEVLLPLDLMTTGAPAGASAADLAALNQLRAEVQQALGVARVQAATGTPHVFVVVRTFK